MRHTFTALLILSLSLPLIPPRGATAAPESSAIAYRISSTYKTVRFPLPADTGSVALSPDTSVVINGKRPAGPWRVTLERGEAAMTIPENSKATGSILGGPSSAIQATSGTSVFWRRPEDGSEGGSLVSGKGSLVRLAAQPTAGVTPTAPPPPAEMAAGQAFTVVDPQSVAWAETKTSAPWMDPLAQASDKGQSQDVVRLPITVPPSAKREEGAPNIKLRPLTLGSATLSLPTDTALKATEKLTRYRERVMLSVPGRGMGGPAAYLDLSPGEPGRIHNTLWSGSRGYVNFHVEPDWKVTMAPGTLVELDAPELVAPGQSVPPKVKLHQGAIMCEPLDPNVAPKGPPGLPPIEGLTVSGEGFPVIGGRAIVYAAQPDEKNTPVQVLSDARDKFKGLNEFVPGTKKKVSPGNGMITILGPLPVAPKAMSQLVPIQAAVPGKEPQLDLTMLGPPPAGRDDVSAKALEVYLQEPNAAPRPVALVIPAAIKSDPGADAEDVQILMVPREVPPNQHLRDVLDRWHQLTGYVAQAVTAPVEAPKEDSQSWVTGAVIALVLVVLVSGGGGKVAKLGRALFGIVRTRCPRCELILDQIPVTEVGTREDQDPVFSLLDFDNLTDLNRQSKYRTRIFDWIRGRGKRVSDAYRFRVRADWCQRCLQGQFTSEVLHDGNVMDESTTDYGGNDTHELLLSLRKPGAAPAPPPAAPPKGGDKE